MGCVSMSRRFFAGGRIDKNAMKRAVLAARVELEPIERQYPRCGLELGGGRVGHGPVDCRNRPRGGMVRGRGRPRPRCAACAGCWSGARSVDAVKLHELRDDRRPRAPRGASRLLSAVLDAFDIERLDVSEMALREGLLFDLVGPHPPRGRPRRHRAATESSDIGSTPPRVTASR